MFIPLDKNMNWAIIIVVHTSGFVASSSRTRMMSKRLCCEEKSGKKDCT